MPPRNPNELARLEDELAYWYNRVGNITLTKDAREYALREARKVEEQLGVDNVSPHQHRP